MQIAFLCQIGAIMLTQIKNALLFNQLSQLSTELFRLLTCEHHQQQRVQSKKQHKKRSVFQN